MSLPEVNSPRARDPDTTTRVSSESRPASASRRLAFASSAAKRARLRWLQSARSLRLFDLRGGYHHTFTIISFSAERSTKNSILRGTETVRSLPHLHKGSEVSCFEVVFGGSFASSW